MKNICKFTALVLPLVFAASSAMGAGFGLYEFSARGNAMGGAVLAGEAEPASLALNPALITDLKGTQVQLGATLVTAKARVTYDGQTTDPKQAFWTLPTFYVTHELADRWYVGLGVFPRFGLGNEYENRNWIGATNIYRVDVQSFSIQPTVAFKATDRLSVSAGLEVMYLSFEEGKRILLGGGNSTDLNIKGDGIGVSAIAALAYKANDKVNFGASFRLRTKQTATGDATFSNQIPGVFVNGDANGDITLPAQLALGVSYRPIEKLLIEFNWMNIFWSSFNSLAINFDKAPGTGMPGQVSEQKAWKDTYRIGVGAEYTLSEVVKLRGSYTFDKSPVNNDYMDVLVPVNDRHLFGAGIGLNLGKNVILDASYTFLLGTSLGGHTPAPQSIPVSYRHGQSHLAGLSVRYAF